MLRSSFIAALALLASACASAPTYTPAASPTGSGYSERQIEANRYFVTYRAAQSGEVTRLQDFALLRAADLTLQNGRDWFWVDRRSLDEEATGHTGPSIGIGIGGGNFGRHTGVGASVGMNFPLGGARTTAQAATLEIRFGEGAKPDDPNAYDARSTSANIRSRLLAAR